MGEIPPYGRLFPELGAVSPFFVVFRSACFSMGDARGMNSTIYSAFASAVLAVWLFLPLAAGAGEAGIGEGFPLRGGASSQSAQSVAASAPSVSPATQVTSNKDVDNNHIMFASSGRSRSAAGERREYSMPSIFPAVFSVLVVCGLFLAALYLVKKYLPGHRQLFSHPAMEVLGRTHLDQRRYVSLLRVGKRIVVVGVSPDEMRALSEITDEEEITGILEVARPKTEPGLTLFQRLFQRHVVDAEKDETRAMAQSKAEEIDEQMSSLRQRVSEIRDMEQPKSRAARSLDTVG